jgi:GT2 family glycosyltransferase
MRQSFKKKEVIVVDNMSTDRTREKIKKYPVIFLEEKRINSYAARNTGIRAASGELIAFIDSDCVATPTWINSLVKNYSDINVGGVGGQILPYKKCKVRSLVEKYAISARCYPAYPYKTKEPIQLRRKKGILLAGVLFTANASFRKSILEKLGGFDEHLRSGGDIDMSYRVQDLGYKLIWDPQAVVYHIQRSTCKDLIKQYFRYGTCVAPLVRKHFEHKRYVIVEHYFNLVKNILTFAYRLFASPFYKGDKSLYLITPILNNLALIALIMGKFYGNLRIRVFII